MDMTTHYLIRWHPRKGLKFVIQEDLMRPRLREISVIPNTRRSRRGLLFPFVYSSLLPKWRDFFHRSSWGSRPRWYSDDGSRIPLIHDMNLPLPKGRERLVLLHPHFCVHILIEFCCHLYKRKEGKHFFFFKKGERERRRWGVIILTLLFNGYGSKNKSGRFWIEIVMS